MRQKLNIPRAEMVPQTQELSILNEIGLAVTQLLDSPKILEFTLDTLTNKLGMAVALIYLWSEEENRYTLQASRGVSELQIEEIERQVLKIPLSSRGTNIGELGVIAPPGQSITPPLVEFLNAVGREIGMTIDNANLIANTKQGEQQAITLYKLGTKISSTLELDKVLDAVAQAARELVHADLALVEMAYDGCLELVIKASNGDLKGKLTGIRIPIDKQPPWSSLIEGQPIVIEGNNLGKSCFMFNNLVEKEQVKSVLIAPLKRGEHFLGLIEVMAREPRRFEKTNAQLLLRLANQVSVSIENAQLYQQLHILAVLEERDRLAREMHDHLSQGLAYIKIKASITEDLLTGGNIDEAQASLLELKRASQVLYTDVREDIFNLRTAVTDRISFFSTLEDYLTNYQNHYGLSVHLEIENESQIEFSPEVASQLLRIIQEALTNVRRHSNTLSATIHCVTIGDWVCISIDDNGKGFDPDEIVRNGKNHYGLQIMRERAETIGGTLELKSQPGQGTRIIVQVPV
jgi:nitrate/nitrite-specific signal transduction histidine kinase